MPRTHFQDFDRDDESPVTIEYTASGGCSAHMGSMTYAGHPGEPPEIEIVKAFNEAGPVTLTQAEDERMCLWLAENHEDDEPDYDDWRD
ncbi:hypothetical protein FHT98_0668 [Bosea sp. AK1]|uniref:hypothetical protein n=1 Tax=Bosea sp. AK1 TaxID=2587160 RepID=UPI00114DFE6E|nr:hypothetical protein [Bosea sp. AK1]TQI72948.1 hypothetical protein FHT98_0668 [Bosea sp. AK1]